MIALSVAAATALGAAMLAALAWRRMNAERSRVERLERELLLFTDASIEVARALDRALHEPRVLGPNRETARRVVLEEALARIATGRPVASVAAELKLAQDELVLLEHRHLAASAGPLPPA